VLRFVKRFIEVTMATYTSVSFV